MLLVLLASLVNFAFGKLSASVSVFDDGKTYLQMEFTELKADWMVLISDDVKQKLPIRRDHVPLIRMAIEPIHYYPKRSFCIFIAEPETIICNGIHKRIGQLQGKPFPETYQIPEVTELTPNDTDIYNFSNDQLLMNAEFESLASRYLFPKVEDSLRQANLKMIANQRVKVYLSLTTSPSRLSLLHYTLSSLDLTLVDAVFVTLPYRFKDREPYTIPVSLQTKFPKLKFLKTQKDSGPVLKLTGAVQYLTETLDDPVEADRAMFIVIDDDQYYSLRTIDSLVYYSLMNPGHVITAATHRYYHANDTFAWPGPITQIPTKELSGKTAADCEGFAGVAFRGYHVDYPLMLFFSDSQRDEDLMPCRFSDDVIIALVIQLRGHPIFSLQPRSSSFFYSRFERFDLPNYQDRNALHRLNSDGTWNEHQHTHKHKYDRCITQLQSYYLDSNLQFKDLPNW